MTEIWKPIPSHPTYEVSNMGNVRTNKPRNKNAKASGYREIKLSTLKKRPYRAFSAYEKGKSKTVLVHRAVLEAFLGPCPDGMEACHNDGVHHNNKIENLRWDTRSSNSRDQIKHGTHSSFTNYGTRRSWSKFDPERLEEVRKCIADGISDRELGRRFSVAGNTIRDIRLGKRFKRETGNKVLEVLNGK